MSKKKTRRRKKSPPIKMINCGQRTDTPVKTHFWDKHISLPFQILFVAGIIILIILIFFVSAYLSGKKTLKSQGYNSPEELITGYLTALDNNDSFELQRCYDLHSVNGRSDYMTDWTEAKEMHKKIEINTDTIDIETHPYDNIADIIRNTQNTEITSANMSQAVFEISRKTEDLTCLQKCLYRFLVYEYNSKWYLYAKQETMSYTVKTFDKNGNEVQLSENIDLSDLMTVGNDTVGYISIDKSWIEMPESGSVTAEKIYSNPDGTAEISLAMTDAYNNKEEFADNLYQTLMSSDNFASSLTRSDVKLGEYNAVLISCTNKDAGQIFSTWILDIPLKDGYVHYITFECTAENALASTYVNLFHF